MLLAQRLRARLDGRALLAQRLEAGLDLIARGLRGLGLRRRIGRAAGAAKQFAGRRIDHVGQQLRRLLALEPAEVAAHRRRALAGLEVARPVGRLGRAVVVVESGGAAAAAGARAARLIVVALREVAGAVVRLAQLGRLDQAPGLLVERLE